MKEEFLHYVWQHRHFDFLNASTTDGKSLEIVYPGVLSGLGGYPQ